MSDYCIENDGARRAELAAIHGAKAADKITEQAAEIDRLREALNGLACEVAGLNAFDAGMRDVIGNSNWSCVRGKLEVARAALHKEPTP